MAIFVDSDFIRLMKDESHFFLEPSSLIFPHFCSVNIFLRTLYHWRRPLLPYPSNTMKIIQGRKGQMLMEVIDYTNRDRKLRKTIIV